MIRRASLAVLLALAVAVPLAVTGTAPPARAIGVLPPGPATDWSYPMNGGLSTCASQTVGNLVNTGGWDSRRFYLATPQTPHTGQVFAVSATLSEPCIAPSGRIGVLIRQLSSPMTRPSEVRWARGALDITMIECVNSAGNYRALGPVTIISRLLGDTSVDLAPNIQTEMAAGTQTTWMSTNCARIISMRGAVTISYTSTGTPAMVVQIEWLASRAIANVEYDDTPRGIESGCEVNPDAYLCDQYVGGNPADYLDTCGEADNAEWYGVEYATLNPVDGATWGPWFAWIAACLFVPIENGGFDRDGLVADAWDMSPNRLAAEGIAEIPASLATGGSCGVLFSTGPETVLPNFTIDTCTWTWAGPAKAALGIGVLLGGLVWFVVYCFRAVVGVFFGGFRSPVDGGDRD